MGGIDWAGLDLVAAKLGIDDIEGLIERLYVIKTHRPRAEEEEAQRRRTAAPPE